ncbi:MAG TPA: hypothetical protein VGN01_12785 [Acidobacteriaceae bacterium]|jgi:hypothetical protein
MEYATQHSQNAWRARARETASRCRTTPPALAMQAMAVEFPHVHGHPNRLPFEGVLTLVDVASDKAPSGARGHRVILTRAAAEAALPSLLGMAVDYKAGWDGHDARQKCGIITAAELEGRRLIVSGFLFSKDFPEIAERLAAGQPANACHSGVPSNACHSERAHRANEESPHLSSAATTDGPMGMSYELADAHVADMSASIWTLTRATFTGAAILLRDKAAYRDTSFRLGTQPRPGGPSFAASSQRVGCRSRVRHT